MEREIRSDSISNTRIFLVRSNLGKNKYFAFTWYQELKQTDTLLHIPLKYRVIIYKIFLLLGRNTEIIIVLQFCIF